MKKCVLLHGMYVIGIIQPRQCKKNEETNKQTNEVALFLFMVNVFMKAA